MRKDSTTGCFSGPCNLVDSSTITRQKKPAKETDWEYEKSYLGPVLQSEWNDRYKSIVHQSRKGYHCVKVIESAWMYSASKEKGIFFFVTPVLRSVHLVYLCDSQDWKRRYILWFFWRPRHLTVATKWDDHRFQHTQQNPAAYLVSPWN